ncbi:AtpZ/AtpI family protein [Chthonobacter albigriseus]|uniref:AtpZ/AtpI family protein n=1 Tax=Chthonobacter albigriseus TaxID=1683161 RepID=UPI0015EED02F|nr:AtpZ/AtpI family protein [Chthonobacter albigriseus]
MNADDERGRMENGDDGAPGGDRHDERLKALREKIEAGKRRDAERLGQGQRSSTAGMAEALKLGSEFVAGVIVGAAFGWAFDYFLGTSPWGLIVFLLLGFAAGTLNVMRATGRVAEPDPRRMRRPRDDGKT